VGEDVRLGAPSSGVCISSTYRNKGNWERKTLGAFEEIKSSYMGRFWVPWVCDMPREDSIYDAL
jgi:hypothetical protein